MQGCCEMSSLRSEFTVGQVPLGANRDLFGLTICEVLKATPNRFRLCGFLDRSEIVDCNVVGSDYGRRRSIGDLSKVFNNGGSSLPGAGGDTGSTRERTACTLVPPMPNEVTAAISIGADGSTSVDGSMTLSSAEPMRGLGPEKPESGGTTWWWSTSAVLASPASPAAASRCPMVDLRLPK